MTETDGGFADSCNYDSAAVTARTSTAHSVGSDTQDEHVESHIPQPNYDYDHALEYVPPDHNRRSDPATRYDEVQTARKRPAPRTQEDEIFELKGKVQVLLESAIGPSNALFRNRHGEHYPLNLDGWQKGGAPGATSEGIFFRGRSFKTQYHGPSHLFSFVGEFPELSDFMRGILQQIPVMRRARDEMMNLKKIEHENSDVRPTFEREKLLRLIPPRDESDKLVQMYLNDFETSYRILHVPTFKKQYSQFWTAPNEARTDFMVTLVLVLAVVYCVPVPDPVSFVGFSSTRRNSAIEWIALCASWLDGHSQKHTTLSFFQIHCLLYLARRMNIVKVKRTWTSAGYLLRRAMEAGLHREPTLLGNRISLFDQEMRRRLWATICEFELQEAVDRGMIPGIHEGDWDSKPPANINDEDFDESCTALPPSKPLAMFTNTAFLHFSAKTLGTRLEVVSILNRLESTISYEKVLIQDEKLLAILDDIPAWGTEPTSPPTPQTNNSSTNLALMPRSFIWLQIHQFLIMIHRPFAQGGLQQSRHRYSRNSCISSALSTLNRYTQPDINADFSLCVFRSDVFRAAFSLCYDLVTLRSEGSSFEYNAALGDHASNTQHINLIEKALTLLEEKVTRLGQAMHQYLFLACAFSLARMRFDPDDSPRFKQNAVDRMTFMCFKILSSQVDGQAGQMRHSDRVAGVGTVPAGELSGLMGTGLAQKSFATPMMGGQKEDPDNPMVTGIPTPDISAGLPDFNFAAHHYHHPPNHPFRAAVAVREFGRSKTPGQLAAFSSSSRQLRSSSFGINRLFKSLTGIGTVTRNAMSSDSTTDFFPSNYHAREKRWTEIDHYTLSHLHPSTHPTRPLLDSTLHSSLNAGLPDISSYPVLARFFALLCLSKGVTSALEVGTLGGYTSIYLALQNPRLRVTSLEVDEYHAKVAKENAEKAGVGDRVDIIVGPAMESLKKVRSYVEEGKRSKFGFVWVDADKHNNWNYVDRTLGMCEPGAVICIDNLVCGGDLVKKPEEVEAGWSRAALKGARDVIEMAGKDERLEGVVMQFVGEKGWDGFLMGVVKP
ncbi:MAG: hypothetical protein Q9227_007195 [Pyrenula ochraceoflavens]